MQRIESMCIWNETEEDLKSHMDHGYFPVATMMMMTSGGEQYFTIYLPLKDVKDMDAFQMADALGQSVTKELLLVSQKSTVKMGRAN